MIETFYCGDCGKECQINYEVVWIEDGYTPICVPVSECCEAECYHDPELTNEACGSYS